ncbi:MULTISPECIES: helix-turn-helix domain-containing protein [Enterobacterales]|uniref:helix-turn-helix domain-containing protein n=1 Tax=Enterobacterales TaxID=91347 RepID=UPI0009B7087D|nr:MULTISPECIES: helix-turn-helix transcriptional regulator [Enterobacterales]ARB83053.1 XRE family transcriptional regulator [Yersinia sp. FDAARGOS_228]AVL36803.1 XRE family transcriptional regulator [Yersinia intermedia]MBI0277986.1 helix-turn-helix transcriptional regulator [Hafnia alvei]PNK96903.1 XRE family transcriptional regulator [Hafnia alvei]
MSGENPFPLRLRQARMRAGLSQRGLGILIGFDPGSASSRMNHYEKGRHTPDIETLQRLARELDVPLHYFFCVDDVSAELACLIERMNTEQRAQLLQLLKEKTSVPYSEIK